MANVTFLNQQQPIDEYGRAVYAVARSIIRAMLDQVTAEDLTDMNIERGDLNLRQLAKVARLERDKGMRGDGFEWAVHEAILGEEPRVIEPVSDALKKLSRHLTSENVSSVMFGHERAKYLGFLEAVIDTAGEDAVLLPDGRGHPYKFGPWVSRAARGKASEEILTARIQQVWKTDLFLTAGDQSKHVAATIKSNVAQLEGGRGLRIGIVPESAQFPAGIRKHKDLTVVALPDPNGFMGLFNDAYMAVGRAICTLGKHDQPPYYTKPSAKATRVQEQLEKYPTAKVVDIEDALNKAAQQGLIGIDTRLVKVNAPAWLHLTEHQAPVIAVQPRFEKID